MEDGKIGQEEETEKNDRCLSIANRVEMCKLTVICVYTITLKLQETKG